MFDFFEVGGAVRDRFLGVDSKDVDFSCVAQDPEEFGTAQDAFQALSFFLEDRGFKVFLSQPEFFTIRAQVPVNHELQERTNVADFVLARKDGPSSDGRRPDWVKAGTLMDDLSRRDFTVNAMAFGTHGELFDPFNGQQDLNDRVLRFVGNPMDRLHEDGLRAVRALRFSVTKGMILDPETENVFDSFSINDWKNLLRNVSTERVKDELHKMFVHNTLDSLNVLQDFPRLRNVLFNRPNLNLVPTMKKL